MLKEALLVNVHKYTLNSTFSGQRQIFCDIRKTTYKLEANQMSKISLIILAH